MEAIGRLEEVLDLLETVVSMVAMSTPSSTTVVMGERGEHVPTRATRQRGLLDPRGKGGAGGCSATLAGALAAGR